MGGRGDEDKGTEGAGGGLEGVRYLRSGFNELSGLAIVVPDEDNPDIP